MKAYIDYNVWVDRESGNYFIDAFRKTGAEYFFSDNLIDELLEVGGNPKVSPQIRLE